jgi:hypothetical protein
MGIEINNRLPLVSTAFCGNEVKMYATARVNLPHIKTYISTRGQNVRHKTTINLHITFLVVVLVGAKLALVGKKWSEVGGVRIHINVYCDPDGLCG